MLALINRNRCQSCRLQIGGLCNILCYDLQHFGLQTGYQTVFYSIGSYIPIIKNRLLILAYFGIFEHILVHFERVWQCLGTRLSKCFMVILVGNNSGKVAVAWKEVKKVGHEQHRQLWAKRRACRRVAYERRRAAYALKSAARPAAHCLCCLYCKDLYQIQETWILFFLYSFNVSQLFSTNATNERFIPFWNFVFGCFWQRSCQNIMW